MGIEDIHDGIWSAQFGLLRLPCLKEQRMPTEDEYARLKPQPARLPQSLALPGNSGRQLSIRLAIARVRPGACMDGSATASGHRIAGLAAPR